MQDDLQAIIDQVIGSGSSATQRGVTELIEGIFAGEPVDLYDIGGLPEGVFNTKVEEEVVGTQCGMLVFTKVTQVGAHCRAAFESATAKAVGAREADDAHPEGDRKKRKVSLGTLPPPAARPSRGSRGRWREQYPRWQWRVCAGSGRWIGIGEARMGVPRGVCQYWYKGEACPYGGQCRFAHAVPPGRAGE